MTRITDRERIAVAALESIAARGIATVNVLAKAIKELVTDDDAASPVCPEHGPVFDEGVICMCGEFQCPACGELQPNTGPCLDGDCLTAIARAALDELRRMS